MFNTKKKRKKVQISESPIGKYQMTCQETSLFSFVNENMKSQAENVQNLKKLLSQKFGLSCDKKFILDCKKKVIPQKKLIEDFSQITQVAKDRHWWAPNSKEALLSHPRSHTTYAMGGVLHVPFADIPCFRQAFLLDIKQENIHYYCETAISTEKMQLAFDLDIENMNPLDVDFDQMISIAMQSVADFLPSRVTLRAIVCISLPYMKQRDGLSYHHWGIHIYFDDVIVDVDLFFQIRYYYIDQLRRRMGERKKPDKNVWEDVVDKNTPTTGLRLIFARKPDKCPYLPEKMKKCKFGSCSFCGGAPGIPGNSIYVPSIFYENGQINREKTNQIHNWAQNPQLWDEVIRICSIRPYAEGKLASEIPISPDLEIPVGAKIPPNLRKQRSVRTLNLNVDSLSMDAKKKPGSQVWIKMDFRSQVFKILQSLWSDGDFRDQLHEPFKEIAVTKSEVFTNTTQTALTIRTKTHFCLNIGKEHAKCCIYFVISRHPKTKSFCLFQHCFCRNHCVGFRSEGYLLPIGFSQLLFPSLSHETPQNIVIHYNKKTGYSQETKNLNDVFSQPFSMDSDTMFRPKSQAKKKESPFVVAATSGSFGWREKQRLLQKKQTDSYPKEIE